MSVSQVLIQKLPRGGYAVYDTSHGPESAYTAKAAFTKIEEALEFIRIELMSDEERKDIEARNHQARMMSNAPLGLGDVKWQIL